MDDALKGVTQLSRKGRDDDPGIRNFTEPELKARCEIAVVIAGFI